jgi:ribosomal protein S18 acetylase RimI-like enzyme
VAEHAGIVDTVELGVEPENRIARALYERDGFEYTGERLGFLIMRKALASS